MAMLLPLIRPSRGDRLGVDTVTLSQFCARPCKSNRNRQIVFVLRSNHCAVQPPSTRIESPFTIPAEFDAK
jgi:hypothetical protein